MRIPVYDTSDKIVTSVESKNISDAGVLMYKGRIFNFCGNSKPSMYRFVETKSHELSDEEWHAEFKE